MNITAAQWSEWALDTFRIEDQDLLAEEVAVQFPSPGEADVMDIPEQAKELRRTLLARIEEASDLEAAREVMFEFAEALMEVA